MGEYKFGKAAFIGAGKIASSLLPAVTRTGIEVIQVISSSLASAKELAERNNITHYADNIGCLSDAADIVFLSVPDSQIQGTADEISKLNISFSGKLFIHLSGAKDIHDLNGLKHKSASIASIHIMQSFPDKVPVDLAGCPAAIETDSHDVQSFLYELCKKMKLLPFFIKPEEKVYYHMMGVFALNFISANFYNSDQLRKKTGEDIPEAKELLANAAFHTLKNIEQKGAIEALSGPIERGDIATIKHHIESIKNDKLLLFNYISSSLTLINVAGDKKSISQKSYEEMKTYLENELKLVCSNYIHS